ncbi:uncharacterized protein SPSC_03821 [Sporisorium scitamineum]|uniref:Uncharacterized protein n=1 Tax=Sporisorium scitamineum TaxID=49012 RepID=A0A127Z2W0_9BASI|nr:uncharacterized protein SPSC_03821 [Sporisorium scitamineum]
MSTRSSAPGGSKPEPSSPTLLPLTIGSSTSSETSSNEDDLDGFSTQEDSDGPSFEEDNHTSGDYDYSDGTPPPPPPLWTFLERLT